MSTIPSLFRLYWQLTQGYRRSLACGIIAQAAIVLLGLFPPVALGLLVDSVSKGEGRWSPAAISTGYITAFFLQGLIRFPMRLGFSGTASRVTAAFRDRYAKHLLVMSPPSLTGRPTGDLMSRATADLGAVEAALATGLPFLLGSLFHLVTLPIAMTLVSPRLCALALSPLPFIVIFARSRVRQIATASEDAQEALGNLTARIHENTSAIQTVRSFGLEAREIFRFEALTGTHLERSLALTRSETGFSTALRLATILTTSAMFLVGGWMAVSGRLSVGQFLASIQYVTMTAWPAMGFSWGLLLLRKGELGLCRIREVLDLPAVPRETGESLPAGPVEIELRHLTYRYSGASAPTLKDVSMTICAGERVALVGPTGGGKSTVLDLLTRVLEPPPGTIFFNGRDIRSIRLIDFRYLFSVAPQEPYLFRGSVRQNVLDGSVGVPDEMVVGNACHAAYLTQNPGWLDPTTPVSGRGANLSGGQRQRVALARALARQAPVLILDDALSGLDLNTEEGVFRAIAALPTPRTSIVVTHRISRARRSDRIVVFDGGRLVETGTHKDLLKANGTYAGLARHQLTLSVFEGE